MKPPTASGAGEEAAPKATGAPFSRRRIFLLSLLLVVVVALGARNFIRTYVRKGSDTPLPAPARVVTPPTDQAAQPSPPPAAPAPERSAKASDSEGVAASKLPLTPFPEKSAEPDSPQARAVLLQEPTEPLAPPATSRGRFSVQVGAMAHEANAHALGQRLEKLGYPVTIRKGRGSTTQHIVLVAAPSDRSEADALMERLKSEGVPALLGESEGGYRVEAGRSVGLDQAIDLAHELQKKGFTPKIVSETTTTTLYLVRVGQFARRGEASQRAKELREKGFPALIVKR